MKTHFSTVCPLFNGYDYLHDVIGLLIFSETMWSVRYIATTPENMIVDAEVEAVLPVASVGSALASVTRSPDVIGSSAPSENYQSLLFTGDVRELEYYAKV